MPSYLATRVIQYPFLFHLGDLFRDLSLHLSCYTTQGRLIDQSQATEEHLAIRTSSDVGQFLQENMNIPFSVWTFSGCKNVIQVSVKQTRDTNSPSDCHYTVGWRPDS